MNPSEASGSWSGRPDHAPVSAFRCMASLNRRLIYPKSARYRSSYPRSRISRAHRIIDQGVINVPGPWRRSVHSPTESIETGPDGLKTVPGTFPSRTAPDGRASRKCNLSGELLVGPAGLCTSHCVPVHGELELATSSTTDRRSA